jgi:hypothetical protein
MACRLSLICAHLKPGDCLRRCPGFLSLLRLSTPTCRFIFRWHNADLAAEALLTDNAHDGGGENEELKLRLNSEDAMTPKSTPDRSCRSQPHAIVRTV